MRDGSWNGRTRRKRSWIRLKIAVFAPMPRVSVRTETNVNAGDFRSCRSANRMSVNIIVPPQAKFSLITERDHWIDPRGPPSGNKTRNRRDQGQHAGDRKIDRRIERVDLEQNIFQRSRRDDSQQQRDTAGAEDKTNRQLPRALRHDHSEYPSCISPKRHPNAELLRSLIHREAHHAVEPDSGENERNDSKDREQRGDEPVTREDFVVESRGRSGEIRPKT